MKRFSASDLGPGTSWADLVRSGRAGRSWHCHESDGVTARQEAAPTILKIKEIVATVTELRVIVVPDKVIVQGVEVEQVFFVDTENIVREFEVRVPFSQQVVLPGADPAKVEAGLQRVEVRAEIEFVVAHLNETGTAIVQKVVILLEVTLIEKITIGDVIVEQVVATARQQVFIVKIKVPPVPPPPPPPPVPPIVIEQVLIVERKPLEAIKIKRVDAEVRNVTAQPLQDKVIVSGIVHKQVAFVGPDNIVRLIQEDIPFSHPLVVPGVTPTTPVTVSAVVEFLIPELDVREGELVQKIILIVSAQVA